MIRRLGLALGFVIAVAAGFAQQSRAADLPDGQIRFVVFREGTSIGTHTLDVRHEGDKMIIDIKIALQVDILFATVYRYEQTRREVWQNGQLVSFVGTANDDGDQFQTEGKVIDGQMAVTVTGDTTANYKMPTTTISNSYWNVALIKQTHALHTTDGRYVPITVTDMGEEMVTAGGKPVLARRYRIDGLETQAGKSRELWYDNQGRWVKMRLEGSDGSQVEWILQ